MNPWIIPPVSGLLFLAGSWSFLLFQRRKLVKRARSGDGMPIPPVSAEVATGYEKLINAGWTMRTDVNSRTGAPSVSFSKMGIFEPTSE